MVENYSTFIIKAKKKRFSSIQMMTIGVVLCIPADPYIVWSLYTLHSKKKEEEEFSGKSKTDTIAPLMKGWI